VKFYVNIGFEATFDV